jgi:nucleotide sugar dehydrogenase
MRVAVVALGKIGLPLAVQCARKGHLVTGADVNAVVVAQVNAAVEPFPGEADLADYLASVVSSGHLVATTDTVAAVASSEAVIVVVPLIVDHNSVPDFRAMDAATAAIARGLKPGTLVSYETTLPLGTTRNRFTPALEAGSGLQAGVDFFVCHSPERVYSGRIFADLRKYPKLVGGIDIESAARSVEFYKAILDFDDRPDLARGNGVWDLGSAEAAEFAKLAETTYRDVNIGLANTFARHADLISVDILQVIDACNTQPFSHIHRPGAVGGHCIPVYPRFYLSNDPSAVIVRSARETNDEMPAYFVDHVARELGSLQGRRVAVLGAAYRGGVKETAFSGVFGVVRAIASAGGIPLVHDPLYTDIELLALGFEPFHFGEACDACIVQNDHIEYRNLQPTDIAGARVLYDARDWVVNDPFISTACRVITLGRTVAETG